VRATVLCVSIMLSSSWCPDTTNSSATRRRCSGWLPAPIRRIVASDDRRLRMSYDANLVDFRAMSSPNHFACSCASALQPTLTSSAE
jgi:hypothetical protein